MLGIKVEIVRFVEDCQPGIVECMLVDAGGRPWTFVEKGPVVSADYLDENSPYPRPGVIACEEVGRRLDPAGHEVVTVDTERPWGVESVEGTTRFEVFAESLTEI